MREVGRPAEVNPIWAGNLPQNLAKPHQKSSTSYNYIKANDGILPYKNKQSERITILLEIVLFGLVMLVVVEVS